MNFNIVEFEDDILGGGEGDGRLLSAGQGVKYALHGRLQNMIRYVIKILHSFQKSEKELQFRNPCRIK